MDQSNSFIKKLVLNNKTSDENGGIYIKDIHPSYHVIVGILWGSTFDGFINYYQWKSGYYLNLTDFPNHNNKINTTVDRIVIYYVNR